MQGKFISVMCRLMVTLAAVLLAACGSPGGDQQDAGDSQDAEDLSATAKVTGTVSYRERMALSPEAVLHVWLNDVSLADASAKTLGEQVIRSPGQVPIAFSIDYDPSVIDERFSYSVRAEIRDRGRLQFVTDQHNVVLTRGAGSTAELNLVRVSGEEQKTTELTGTRWELAELDGEPVSVKPDREPTHFLIDGETSQIAGFAGCNRFSGNFWLKEGKPKIGPMAVTAMACADGMEQEQVFLRALETFTRYEIEGETLRLFIDRLPVASFSAGNET